MSIATISQSRAGRPTRQRIAAIDRALATLSRLQDSQLINGQQICLSQSQIAEYTGLTRSRVEQLEMSAKLHFLKKLAIASPQTLLELGANYFQLAFLQEIDITSTNSRDLWRNWTQLSSHTNETEEQKCQAMCLQNMN